MSSSDERGSFEFDDLAHSGGNSPADATRERVRARRARAWRRRHNQRRTELRAIRGRRCRAVRAGGRRPYDRRLAHASLSPAPNPNAMKSTLDTTLPEVLNVTSADAAAGHRFREAVFTGGVVSIYGVNDFVNEPRPNRHLVWRHDSVQPWEPDETLSDAGPTVAFIDLENSLPPAVHIIHLTPPAPRRN
jgi:hypothetical protein